MGFLGIERIKCTRCGKPVKGKMGVGYTTVDYDGTLNKRVGRVAYAICGDCKAKFDKGNEKGRFAIPRTSGLFNKIMDAFENPDNPKLLEDVMAAFSKSIEKKETIRRCNVCGHVYCFSDEDLERNQKLAKSALTDSVLGLGNALGGTGLGAQVATARAEDKLEKMVDYSKCPKCNSSDVHDITKAEYEKLKQSKSNSSATTASSADEIKKFKELLDMGAITQEEFEAKKKELLGI